MEKIEVTRLGGKDLLSAVFDQSNLKVGYEKAYSQGKTFSAYLEELSPTEPSEKLDAFQRALQYCGIVLKNDAEKGVYAGHGDLFFQSNMPESRILFPEFINRTIRAAMIARADFLSYIVSDWEYSTTGLFRSFYLDDTSAKRKMGRKGVGTAPKIIKASWSEKPIQISKFGIELQMDYDFVRGASLPLISLVLQRVAMEKAIDELIEAVYVLMNGDGSGKEANGATDINLSDYQTAHTGSKDLTYISWLKFLSQFYPGKATTVVGSMADLVNFICMAKPTTDPVFMYELLNKSLTGGIPEIVENPFGNVALVPFPDATTLPAETFLGVDKQYGLMGHRDVGVDLIETDRLIRGQFEQVVITNKVGFSTIFQSAAKTLDCDG
jgi:hypothetical protein